MDVGSWGALSVYPLYRGGGVHEPLAPAGLRSRALHDAVEVAEEAQVVADGAVVFDVLGVGEDRRGGIGGRGQRIDPGPLAIGDRRGNVLLAVALQIRAQQRIAAIGVGL